MIKYFFAFESLLELSRLNFLKALSIEFFKKLILLSELYDPIFIIPPIFKFGNSLNGPTFSRNILVTPIISSMSPIKPSINPIKIISSNVC